MAIGTMVSVQGPDDTRHVPVKHGVQAVTVGCHRVQAGQAGHESAPDDLDIMPVVRVMRAESIQAHKGLCVRFMLTAYIT